MADYPEKENKNTVYDAEKWAKKTEVGKRLFVWNFFMRGEEVPGWTLLKTIPEQNHDDKRLLSYMWQDTADDQEVLIKIDIAQASSWSHAQQALWEMLGEYQTLELQEAASRKFEFGDVAYIGFGDMIQSAIFTRANMIVRIRSVGAKDVSVINMAKKLDGLFVTKSQFSEKNVIPEIEKFSSDITVVKTNQSVPLDIKATDPLGRSLWYKFMTDHGEIFSEDQKISFLSKTQGQPEISLLAVNENGFSAGATLSIKVE